MPRLPRGAFVADPDQPPLPQRTTFPELDNPEAANLYQQGFGVSLSDMIGKATYNKEQLNAAYNLWAVADTEAEIDALDPPLGALVAWKDLTDPTLWVVSQVTGA